MLMEVIKIANVVLRFLFPFYFGKILGSCLKSVHANESRKKSR